MKKYVLISLIAFIMLSMSVYLSGCYPISGQVNHADSLINLYNESGTLRQNWSSNHLFQNSIQPLDDKILLENDGDSTSIEIRAFQHHFFDSVTIMPATWVLGYVKAETPIGEERLPGPTIETKYGINTKVHFKNTAFS